MEIQQTAEYAAFIRSLGWTVETLDGSYLYIRRFPFYGGLAKLQRIRRLPAIPALEKILRTHGVRTLAVEPDSSVSQKKFSSWISGIRHVRINTDYFLPTKTVRVSLAPDEADIFAAFSEAKRRAVRRALKVGVSVTVSRDIDAMLGVKNKSGGILGFITTAGMKRLWEHLPEQNAFVVLARASSAGTHRQGAVVGGVFVIIWDKIAYYWIAGAVRDGKRMFAPTLLVWEALRESKRRNCAWFDFVGVWDDREPGKNTQWKGFTKFKEGFGGEPLYYPLPR